MVSDDITSYEMLSLTMWFWDLGRPTYIWYDPIFQYFQSRYYIMMSEDKWLWRICTMVSSLTFLLVQLSPRLFMTIISFFILKYRYSSDLLFTAESIPLWRIAKNWPFEWNKIDMKYCFNGKLCDFSFFDRGHETWVFEKHNRSNFDKIRKMTAVQKSKQFLHLPVYTYTLHYTIHNKHVSVYYMFRQGMPSNL